MSHQSAFPDFRRAIAVVLVMVSFGATADEAADAYARRVTTLADRWLEQVETRFPVTYLGSGLPTDRHDALEQNAPQGLASWREFLAGVEKELATVPEDPLIGRPEWVTWHYLRQGLAQNEAARLCRTELWQVSAFGWVTHLTHLATLQPVGTDALRRQALTRWRGVPTWVDQEIANLREGLRLRYTATQSATQPMIAQLDALLAAEPGKSAFMSPTTRDDAAAFRADWTALIETNVWPALRRYRDFLRDEYLPRARASISLDANTNGLACYRATVYANTTVDGDPRDLFNAARSRERAERAERMVETITGLPGLGVAYPLGAMQFEQMRAIATKELGNRFDLREFHRVMLEDGRLPFGAMRSKMNRWIEKQKSSGG